MIYVKNFKKLLSDLSTYKDQTANFRAFNTKVNLTADPVSIQKLYADQNITRASLSKRLMTHAGALDALVTNTDSVADIKKNIYKKSLNKKNYDKILQQVSKTLLLRLGKTEKVDLHYEFYKAFEAAFLVNLLGIKLSNTLLQKLDEIGYIKEPGIDTSLARLFFLNYFTWTPNFIKDIFAPGLKKRNHQLDDLALWIYHDAEITPNCSLERLKKANADGLLTLQEVFGEIRMTMINASSLSLSLCWAFYLLSKHSQDRQLCSQSIDYCRLVFLETLRLYPPFHMLSYESKIDKKCPMHWFAVKESTVVSVLNTHRSGLNWNEPLKFDPNRFLGGLSKIKKGSYIPFGGGNRPCPGSGLTFVIAPFLIHKICESFDFDLLEEPIPKRRIEYMPLGNKFSFSFKKKNH